jgi:hypothetical protein
MGDNDSPEAIRIFFKELHKLKFWEKKNNKVKSLAKRYF